MDDLIGILFVLVMVGLGLVGKIREQRRVAQEEAERRARRAHAQDLPPETRRQLYGTPDVPVARPRETAMSARPQSAPRTAEPRVARPMGAPRTPPPVPVRPAQQQQTMRAPTQRPLFMGTPGPTPRRQPVQARPATPLPSLRERVQEVQTQLQRAFEEAVEAPKPPIRHAPPVPKGAPRRKKAVPSISVTAEPQHPPRDRKSVV